MDPDKDGEVPADQSFGEKSKHDIISAENPKTLSDIVSVEKKKSNLSESSRPRTSSTTSDPSKATKKKKKGANLDGHKVKFTITIAKAIPKNFTNNQSSLLGKHFIRPNGIRHGQQSKNIHNNVKGISNGKRDPMAFYNGDEDFKDDSSSKKKGGRILEQPKAQNFFHCEYYLLPDDPEPVKTDVVTFGVAAKIYTMRHEPKVIKTWLDGDLTWVAWNDTHTINVTDEILEKLTTHTLELRVWDTRDKLSAKARFDRPKAFRLPQAKQGEDAENLGGTKSLVIKQVGNYTKIQPKKSYINRPLPPHGLRKGESNDYNDAMSLPVSRQGMRKTPVSAASHDSRQSVQSKRSKKADSQVGCKQTPQETEVLRMPTEDGGPIRSYSRPLRLAGEDVTRPHTSKSPAAEGGIGTARSGDGPGTAKSEGVESKRKSTAPTNVPVENKSAKFVEPDDDLGVEKPKKNKKADAAALAAAEHVKKHGICCIPIRMANFFCTDTVSYTNRLDQPLNGLEDLFFTVSLTGSLMSEQQKYKLNPIIIKVQSATDMPDTPINYADLQLKCIPAYVKYKFFKCKEHKSIGRPQGTNVYWDDVNVILTGETSMALLREYLYGPLLEVEVHDRDRILEKPKLKPTLFGDDIEDEKISNVGTVSSKRTLHNPFKDRDHPWDPYGVAKFDLSDLLLGQQTMNLIAAVRPCIMPDVLGVRDGKLDGKLIGIAGAVDGPTDVPLAVGHYVEASTMLKIRVQIVHPLLTPNQLAINDPIPTSPQCPFSRIVFRFDYKNVDFLSLLQATITQLNAAALDLNHLPDHIIGAALSTYKLSVEQQKNIELDIITGFQILDKEMHLFVLEGLRNGGVQHLWNTLPKPENSDIEVLYHSDLSFSERCYGSLDVDVCRIKLHEPLSFIVQQPLLYVRDMVPKPCFQALIKLAELTKQYKLRDAVRNDLFPTADMILSMSREFGVPLTADDFQDLERDTPDKLVPVNTDQQEVKYSIYQQPAKTSRVWTPIDNYNEKYVNELNNRNTSKSAQNFLTENKDTIRRHSELNLLHRSVTMPVTVKANVSRAHNYSTQALNSTELAKEQLRQQLAQKPDKRYTYCPDYHHSMTVVPVNVEALKRKEKEEWLSRFKSPAGWTYPGKKTMIESNIHPKKPDAFRTRQLYEPWQENTLHSTVLKPPLERETYKWSKRHADFDTWSYPNPIFNPDEPISIQAAGDKLKQERLDQKAKDQNQWQSKLIVDDPKMRFWRIANETENLERGLKASNQLERLHGVLKAPPQKYSLLKSGMMLEDVPALSVVLNPSVDTAARLAGIPCKPALPNEHADQNSGFNPGPYTNLSWSHKENHIPCKDYQHDKFITRKGNDLNVYHKERLIPYKRAVAPLNDLEYSRHLFRWATCPDDWTMMGRNNAIHSTMPDLDKFKQMNVGHENGEVDEPYQGMGRTVDNNINTQTIKI